MARRKSPRQPTPRKRRAPPRQPKESVSPAPVEPSYPNPDADPVIADETLFEDMAKELIPQVREALMTPEPPSWEDTAVARAHLRHMPHPAAILLGLGAGWQWTGLRRMIASILDASPGTVTMVAAVVFLAASIGPRVPGRFVLAIASRLSVRWRQKTAELTDEEDAFWMLRAIRDRDASLLWLSFAALTSVAGVVALVTLAATGLFAAVHRWLMAHFLWTELTLSLLEWLSVALLAGAAWVVNGMVVAGLAPVTGARSDARQSPPGIVAGLLVGLGLSWMLHEVWLMWGISGQQEWLLGVLPIFALSIIAAVMTKRCESAVPPLPSQESDAPELTAHAEGWIWLSLVMWACGTMLAFQGWYGCRSWDLPPRGLPAGGIGFGVLLLGAGMALASWHAQYRKRSPSGCGMALWAAGLGVGLAASLTAWWSEGNGSAVVQLLAMALPAGYALHYAERAWLARAGSETLGFAHMTTALLAGCAISLIAGRWWVLPTLGPMGAMSTGTLALLAFGGLVQIYEEESPAHTQRLRLSLVFASLAAAIVLLPANARLWGRQVWNGQALPAAGKTLADFLQKDNTIKRVLLIGAEPPRNLGEADLRMRGIDWVPLHPEHRSASPSSAKHGSAQPLGPNGFRTLRFLRGRYDLVYQACPPPGLSSGAPAYTGEWLSRIAEQTTPGGQVVLEAPLEHATAQTLQVLGITFERALRSEGYCCLAESGTRTTLLLWCRPDRPRGVKPVLPGQWFPVSALLGQQQHMLQAHSLQRDQLSATLLGENAKNVADLTEWLRSRTAISAPSPGSSMGSNATDNGSLR